MSAHEGGCCFQDRSAVAQLGPMRPLRYAQMSAAHDLPAFVRAASAVRRWQQQLVIVQDDLNALALLDERTQALSPVLLPRGPQGRRQFSPALGNKAHKMDLEAAAVLPDGRLLALGSGSTAAREQLVLLSPDLSVRVVEGHALYAMLRGRRDFSGAELNLEGAVILDGGLWLLQRGNGAGAQALVAQNALGRLDLGAFVAWLDGRGGLPELTQVQALDLGEIDGVALGLTDGTALPDGGMVFLAAAEDSADTYEDGPVTGVRVGLWRGAVVHQMEILDEEGAPCLLKLEGIEYIGQSATGALRFAVVADVDDPEEPALFGELRWRRASAGGVGCDHHGGA